MSREGRRGEKGGGEDALGVYLAHRLCTRCCMSVISFASSSESRRLVPLGVGSCISAEPAIESLYEGLASRNKMFVKSIDKQTVGTGDLKTAEPAS